MPRRRAQYAAARHCDSVTPSAAEGRNQGGRRIGLFGATAVVVASMVGTGVFTTTGLLVRDVGSNPAVLFAWLLGGVLALSGALAYGELAAALPNNGGEYQLLGRIYHPAVGFLAGFVSLVVGFSAPIAASALAFGEYWARVVPAVRPEVSALGLVIVASLSHFWRVSLGARVLEWTTVLDVVLIAIVVVAGLPAGRFEYLTLAPQRPFGAAVLSPELAIGLIYVSFAYSGWNGAVYIAGEIRRPGETLPRSLVLGTSIVTLLYLGLNLVFLVAAPAPVISGVIEVGHVAAERLFGETAARVVSAVVSVGLITTVVALVMTGPRVYEKMGEDHPRLAALSGRTARGGPATAILLQAALAIAMIVTATFDALLTYMGFTLSVSAMLAIAGVFVLRIREPELERPYRAWGHPVTTLLAVALLGWMTVHTLLQRPVAAWVGLGTIGAGLLLYLVLGERTAGPRRPSSSTE